MTQQTTHDTAAEMLEYCSVIDINALAAELFDRFAAAQLDLMRARAARDQRIADERLLCMRAAGLLLASLPTDPETPTYRLKVLVAVAFREEDGDEASHAWLMVERAMQFDLQRQPQTSARS